MKRERGITLIALVITIIILIILSAITISALLGEDGLITKAKQGADKYGKAQNEEEEFFKGFDIDNLQTISTNPSNPDNPDNPNNPDNPDEPDEPQEEFKVIGEVQTTSTGGSNASVRVKIYGTSINQNILYYTANNNQDKDFGFFTLSYGKTSLQWRIEENSGCELYYYTSSETIDDKHEIGTENLEWGYGSPILYYIVAKDIFYNITYNLDGGTGETAGYYSENTPTFSLPIPRKTGCYFKGWTGNNGDVPQISVSIANGSTGNKSYTANWESFESMPAIRYYKIVITKLRGVPSSGAIQLEEWNLYDTNQNRYSYPSETTITTTLPGGSSQGIEKLIDNDINTKYCSTSWGSSQTGECTIIIDLGVGNEIKISDYPYYSYCTAYDIDNRDPISWIIYCSEDGENYYQIDSKSDLTTIPTTRKTETEKWTYGT